MPFVFALNQYARFCWRLRQRPVHTGLPRSEPNNKVRKPYYSGVKIVLCVTPNGLALDLENAQHSILPISMPLRLRNQKRVVQDV